MFGGIIDEASLYNRALSPDEIAAIYNAGAAGKCVTKYSPLTLQLQGDGTVLLQAQESPSQSFDIKASADLINWLDLGRVLADANGLMQFDDTSAPQFDSRFYITKPQ